MPTALYVGNADSIRRQKKITRESTWILFSRGAAHAGDCMAADDPDLFGWGAILEHLGEDRIFGFRLIPVGEVLKIRRRLAGKGYRLVLRDAFIGGRDALGACAGEIAKRPLPAGTRLLTNEEVRQPALLKALQQHIAQASLAPRCGEMLAGLALPGVTLVLVDAQGQIIASAHARKPHNKYSDYADHALIEQIAVAPALRKCGLGQMMAARVAMAALEALEAKAIYADIDAEDMAARKIVERCGLTIDGGLQCGEALPGRFAV